MPIIVQKTREEISDRIVRAVAPEKQILFGSYARGDATVDSDLDLLVVQKRPFVHSDARRKEVGIS